MARKRDEGSIRTALLLMGFVEPVPGSFIRADGPNGLATKGLAGASHVTIVGLRHLLRDQSALEVLLARFPLANGLRVQ